MSGLKPFPKKSDKIKLKIKVKMPHPNKKSRENKKFDSNKTTRPRMNYEWIGKTKKKSDPKNRKTVKTKVNLPHVNKKPLAKNRIFVQTAFSHFTLNQSEKNKSRKTTRFFAPLSVSA